MKRKKEIENLLLQINSEKTEYEAEISRLKEEKLGYKSLIALNNDIEKNKPRLEEAKTAYEKSSALLTKDEMIQELTSTPQGEEMYKKYVKDKNKNAIKNCAVGDYVCLGSYYQSSSDKKEPIEWKVLARNGSNAFIVSRYAINCKLAKSGYNTAWENSPIRSWLNGDFYNTAFDYDEKSYVKTAVLHPDHNKKCSSSPGSTTRDKVFLMSATEVEKYIGSSSDRKCKVTSYAKKQGVWSNSNGYCWWWLRTPGDGKSPLCDVDESGEVHYTIGDSSFNDDDGIRPAMWIDVTGYGSSQIVETWDYYVPPKPTAPPRNRVYDTPKPYQQPRNQKMTAVDIMNMEDDNDYPLGVEEPQIGQFYYLGNYYKNYTNIKEPIEWIVISKKNNAVLLLSVNGIDCKPAKNSYGSKMWKDSYIRKWLNNDFYNMAFTNAEKMLISYADLYSGRNYQYGIYDEHVVRDKVFLLSMEELEQTFGPRPEGKRCVATPYAKSKGAWTDPQGFAWWWLRNPGGGASPLMEVSDKGVISQGSTSCYDDDVIRPAVWVFFK